MSKYENFNFISSEVIVTEVKQQLKSYFDSGSLTEIMIPTYISTALRKLKMMTLEWKDTIMEVENYKMKLPSDFQYLDDVYLCNKVDVVTGAVNTTIYDYYKKTYCHDECQNEYETFSQTVTRIPQWITTHLQPTLLKVYYGSRSYCFDTCTGVSTNSHVSSISGSVIIPPDSTTAIPGVHNIDQQARVNDINSMLEVRINKHTLTANFATGTLYLKYYSTPEDEHGPMIPDVIEVENYVKSFITFQLFDQLYNSVTDESINIIERKRGLYKQEYYMHYESALNMLKTQTRQQIRDGINKDRKRFIKYIING